MQSTTKPLITELTETPAAKRFCVQYRETPEGPKPKTRVFHNFLDAIDEGDARKKFWLSPTWNGATKKVEILSVVGPEV